MWDEGRMVQSGQQGRRYEQVNSATGLGEQNMKLIDYELRSILMTLSADLESREWE